ncbi:MAG: GTP-binding protein [Wujia sp.]
MIKIDLITGFLGSGKTTFIKKYAEYLINKGEKIGILENDYGAVNVDMMLLQSLSGDNCGLEMVSGGCDSDCHRRRFKTKLIAMGMSGYNHVLVEPSGIFDVDEFFDTLHEEPLCKWYEIGNVIAIVEATLDERSAKQSDYLLASQLANAGRVIMSKCDGATKDDIQKTINLINALMEKYKCKRRFTDDIMIKSWDEFTDEDYRTIDSSGYQLWDYVKAMDEEKEYTTLYIMGKRIPEAELRNKIEQLMSDDSCGDVFRIKGFIVLDEGGKDCWMEINATHNEISIEEIEKGQEIIIIIGKNLNQQKIESYFE